MVTVIKWKELLIINWQSQDISLKRQVLGHILYQFEMFQVTIKSLKLGTMSQIYVLTEETKLQKMKTELIISFRYNLQSLETILRNSEKLKERLDNVLVIRSTQFKCLTCYTASR